MSAAEIIIMVLVYASAWAAIIGLDWAAERIHDVLEKLFEKKDGRN